MNRKTLVWIGMTVGSGVGGFIPYLWNSTGFFASLFFGTIGAIAGIWVGFKMGS